MLSIYKFIKKIAKYHFLPFLGLRSNKNSRKISTKETHRKIISKKINKKGSQEIILQVVATLGGTEKNKR